MGRGRARGRGRGRGRGRVRVRVRGTVQYSQPHGNATAMNGLRRPQRVLVMSESRPTIAPEVRFGWF